MDTVNKIHGVNGIPLRFISPLRCGSSQRWWYYITRIRNKDERVTKINEYFRLYALIRKDDL